MSPAQKSPTPRTQRKSLGKQGEQMVAEALQAQGFQILERNLRDRGGELDLIAVRDTTLWIVEVKAHTRKRSEGVTISVFQQRRIMRMAYQYLTRLQTPVQHISFTLAVVAFGVEPPEVTFIEHAFESTF
ncbi:MAG: YraN family protein [Myxococcota bacterium]